MLWNLKKAYLESVYRWIENDEKSFAFGELTDEAEEAMQTLLAASPGLKDALQKLWELLEKRGKQTGYQSFIFGFLMGLEADSYPEWLV